MRKTIDTICEGKIVIMNDNACSCCKVQSDSLSAGICQPLVSVIIPVFNTEEQLPRCIESVLGQKMCSIEIILIDDGSTDGSGIICDTYAENDKRVKVFHTPYQGVASARNYGLQKASCEYIMFVDSDDWVSADFCAEAYQCAVNHHTDMVMFGFQNIRKHLILGEAIRTVGINVPQGYKTKKEAIELLFNESGNYCWNKLYRKSLFQNVNFPVGRLYEDVGTLYKVVWKAENIYYLPKSLYNYCSRPGSITTHCSHQACVDWVDMHLQMLQDYSAWGYPTEKLDLYYISYTISYCKMFGAAEAESKIPEFLNRFRQCKTIPTEFTWKRKFLFLLLNYYPFLFDVVCDLWRKMSKQ